MDKYFSAAKMTMAKWCQDGAEHRGLPMMGSERKRPEFWTLRSVNIRLISLRGGSL